MCHSTPSHIHIRHIRGQVHVKNFTRSSPLINGDNPSNANLIRILMHSACRVTYTRTRWNSMFSDSSLRAQSMKTWRCIRLGIVAMLAVKIQLAQQKQQRYSEIDYMPLFSTSIGILDVANCLVHLFVTTFMLKPECPGYNCIYLVHIHTRASMKSPNTICVERKGENPLHERKNYSD